MKFFLLLACLFLVGCGLTRTRDMQEQTLVNLVAETPIGQIVLKGTIDRTQHETSELTMKLPAWTEFAMSGVGVMSGGLGVVGLLGALYATVRRRKDRHKSEQEHKDKDERNDMYMRELCKGIAKWQNTASPEEIDRFNQSLQESMSRDTRHIVQDYI